MADQSNGLLDLLGSLASGLGEIGAYRQAALGNVEPLRFLQEQRQKQNLLNQLSTMAQQPDIAPYQGAIQQRLQLGDIAGAQKLVTDLPRQNQFQKMVMDNPNLTDAQKSGIISQGQINLSEGFKALNNELSAQKREKFTQSKEERALQRQLEKEQRMQETEQLKRNPEVILEQAIKDGVLDSKSTQEEIQGVLSARGASLPANEKQRSIKVKEILNNPKLKLSFPNANLSWWEKILGPSEPKTVAPAIQPAAQTGIKTMKLKSASGQVKEVADTPANRALAKQKNMQIVQ